MNPKTAKKLRKVMRQINQERRSIDARWLAEVPFWRRVRIGLGIIFFRGRK